MSNLDVIQAAITQQRERQRALEEAYELSGRDHPDHPFRGTFTGLKSPTLFLTGKALLAVQDALCACRRLDPPEEQRVRMALAQAPAPTKGLSLLARWAADGKLSAEDQELLLQILRWIEEIYP